MVIYGVDIKELQYKKLDILERYTDKKYSINKNDELHWANFIPKSEINLIEKLIIEKLKQKHLDVYNKYSNTVLIINKEDKYDCFGDIKSNDINIVQPNLNILKKFISKEDFNEITSLYDDLIFLHINFILNEFFKNKVQQKEEFFNELFLGMLLAAKRFNFFKYSNNFLTFVFSYIKVQKQKFKTNFYKFSINYKQIEFIWIVQKILEEIFETNKIDLSDKEYTNILNYKDELRKIYKIKEFKNKEFFIKLILTYLPIFNKNNEYNYKFSKTLLNKIYDFLFTKIEIIEEDNTKFEDLDLFKDLVKILKQEKISDNVIKKVEKDLINDTGFKNICKKYKINYYQIIKLLKKQEY